MTPAVALVEQDAAKTGAPGCKLFVIARLQAVAISGTVFCHFRSQLTLYILDLQC